MTGDVGGSMRSALCYSIFAAQRACRGDSELKTDHYRRDLVLGRGRRVFGQRRARFGHNSGRPGRWDDTRDYSTQGTTRPRGPGMAGFTLGGTAAFVWFGFCWAGYTAFADHSRWRHLSITAAMNRERGVWMNEMLAREFRMVDIQIVRNLLRSLGFFAPRRFFWWPD